MIGERDCGRRQTGKTLLRVIAVLFDMTFQQVLDGVSFAFRNRIALQKDFGKRLRRVNLLAGGVDDLVVHETVENGQPAEKQITIRGQRRPIPRDGVIAIRFPLTGRCMGGIVCVHVVHSARTRRTKQNQTVSAAE